MSIYLHKVKSRWQPGENTVAYYPLTENANDYSGNGYNATNYDGTFSEQNGGYFGTITSRVELPSMTIGQTFTISFWVKLPNGQPTGNQEFDIYYDWSASYRNILLACVAGGINCHTGNNSTSQNIKTVSTTFGTGWNNIILSKTGTSYSIYKNGNLLETFSSTYDISAPGGRNTVSVGHVYNSTSEYSAFGYIKDYIIENKERSAEEVEDYYMLTKGDYHTETQWEPNENTLAYFPFQSDGLDAMGNYTLSNVGAQKTLGRNFTGQTVLNTTPTGINTTLVWMKLNTLGSANYVQVMRLMCWNLCFYVQGNTSNPCFRIYIQPNTYEGGNQIITTGQWHLIGITREKNGTTTTLKGYVDGVEYQIFSGTAPQDTADNQGLIFTNQTVDIDMSDFIMESKTWSADEVLSYYYQTRNDYVDNPWYPIKECEVQNIYIGHLEGYQPNANTIIYFPLTDDIQDHSGKSVTISTTGSPTITTYNGVKCCYFDGSSTIDTSATNNDFNVTWSAWVYQTASGSMFLGNQPCGITQGTALCIGSSGFELYVYNGSSGNSVTVSGTYTGGRHHFLYSNKKIYIDGEYKTTFGYNISIGGNQPINLGGHNANSSCTRSKITGYMGETFIESGEWTAEQVAKYYNDTKNNYTTSSSSGGTSAAGLQ